MSEMIARRGHDEMKIPIGLFAIALGYDGLKRSSCLFEGFARMRGFAVHFAEVQTESKQGVAVRMQIVAEMRRKGRGVWWKNAVPPYHRARLPAGDDMAPESCGHRFIDIGYDRFRRCWHSRSPGHKRRRRIPHGPRPEGRRPIAVSLPGRLAATRSIVHSGRYQKR